MTKHLYFVVFLGSVISSPAALLAHYDFTDGDLTDNEVGPAETLTLVNEGANAITINAQGAAVFPGDDALGERDYLEVDRNGAGSPQFTVSVWFKTGMIDQGGFQGIFSNNKANVANNFSYQLDVHNGDLRMVSATSGFGSLDNTGDGEAKLQSGVWHQVVARKTAAGGGELWLGSEGVPLQLVGNTDLNPGGLQWFRLGANRNTDSLYEMEMANVKIYNDADVSLIDLNNEGPQLIPEPSTGLLALLSLPALLGRRRTRR